MAKTTKYSSKNTKVMKKTPPASKAKKGGTKTGGQTAEDRILEAIAEQMAFGNDKPERKVIQAFAKMLNKKSFDTTILNMRKKKNLVLYDTSTIWLTEDGLEKVGPEAIARPANNDAMHEKVKEGLKTKRSREIFDLLKDGKAYSRKELAEMMNMEDNKSFGTHVSGLSKIVERENGKIRLQQMYFPCGRPCDS